MARVCATILPRMPFSEPDMFGHAKSKQRRTKAPAKAQTSRRVPNCEINACCPFRSNLCQISKGCHGSLEGRALSTDPSGSTMVTVDGEVIVIDRDGAKTLSRWAKCNEGFSGI